MIAKTTLEFLSDLRRNNYKEWFHANRPRYEAAREDVLANAGRLVEGINRFDPSLGTPDLTRLIYRINRNLRFSADKRPYKTHFGVVMNADGDRHSPLSGYYMHVEPDGMSVVSCGLYITEENAGSRNRVRQAIDEHWEEFSAIVHAPSFREHVGDLCREDRVLKRVPRGFSADSPAAEYLKLNHFYVWKQLPDELVTSDRYIPEALRLYELMKPLNDFLNRAVGR
jgi:uncharacterized protein (TIGR02453 family)